MAQDNERTLTALGYAHGYAIGLDSLKSDFAHSGVLVVEIGECCLVYPHLKGVGPPVIATMGAFQRFFRWSLCMPGPLNGVRVIDFTTMIAGPYSTMLLADQGADVIKIEAPMSSDHARRAGYGQRHFTATFLNNNRNKRSVAIDVKTEEGLEVLLRLARSADVFVQNFRPGVMQRLGIDYEDLREVNPSLIYVSLSGWGEKGPWAHKPVYDPIIQAISGLTTVQAGSDSARPRLIRTVLPDKLTAVTAAQALSRQLYSLVSAQDKVSTSVSRCSTPSWPSCGRQIWAVRRSLARKSTSHTRQRSLI